MIEVWNDYNQRVTEINIYFDFMYSTIDSALTDEKLAKILKANGFLMLYNMVESTVRNAIEEIHVAFSNDNLLFSKAILEIQALWIEFSYRNFKEKKSLQILKEFNLIVNDIISIEYQEYIKRFPNNDLSGNIDKRVVEGLAEKYKLKKNTRIAGSGLFTIKTTRNNLAHGNKTFTEVGKSHEISDMKKFKKESVLFLRELLINIEKYINNKEYRTST